MEGKEAKITCMSRAHVGSAKELSGPDQDDGMASEVIRPKL